MEETHREHAWKEWIQEGVDPRQDYDIREREHDSTDKDNQFRVGG